MTDGLTNAYNPMRAQSATLSWTDLNGDDVAQGERGCTYLAAGCEINFGQLPSTFGQVVPGCSVLRTDGATPCGTAQLDADRTREYTILYGVGVQHELLPRVSVSANWFHSDFHNLGVTYNALQTFSDYTMFSVASPIDGSPIAMYNVSNAARTRVLTLETNATDRQRTNTAVEFNFSARLPHGATLFGGLSTDRTLQVACDDPSNPNNLLYCDQRQNDIPWLTQYKTAGSMPLKWGVTVGAAYQSYRYILTGGTVWQITPTTRYAADCKGACTPGALVNPGMTVATLNVPLEAPGRQLSDRITQLDSDAGQVDHRPQGSAPARGVAAERAQQSRRVRGSVAELRDLVVHAAVDDSPAAHSQGRHAGEVVTRGIPMRVKVFVCVCLMGLSLAWVTAQSNAGHGAILLEGARLITGEGTAPVESSAVLIENGHISRVGRKGEVPLPRGGTRVDVTGKTVMPALVDMHNHIGWTNQRTGVATKTSFTRANVVDHLERYAYYGVAAALSMGLDRWDVNPDLPYQLRNEVIPNAARFLTVGRGIAATPMAGPVAEYRLGVPYGAQTEAEGIQRVHELHDRKVEMIRDPGSTTGRVRYRSSSRTCTGRSSTKRTGTACGSWRTSSTLPTPRTC
ncbi:MAG: hypothetical protein QM736_00690 [Vicinamibacterales bacterium]